MSTSRAPSGNNIHTIRSHNKSCHYWVRGNCRFASACKFRHDPEERNKFKKAVNIDKPGERGSPVNLAINSGTQAIAEGDDFSRFQQPQATSSDNPINPNWSTWQRQHLANFPIKIKPCRNWKDGECVWGENCRFSHGDQVEVEQSGIDRRAQDIKVVEQHLVLDSTLVSFGAGLEIQNVIAGFDLCTMRISNLPTDSKRGEIEDLFVQQGVKKSDFLVLQIKSLQESDKLEAVVLIDSQYGHVLAPGLEGTSFRTESLTFKVDDKAIGTSMNTAGPPFIIVTWRLPSDTIIAGYSDLENARNMAQKLNMTMWKNRQIRAVMNERPQGVVGLRNFNAASVKIMNLPSTGMVPYDLPQLTGTIDHKLLKSPCFNVEESHGTIRAHLSKLPGVLMESYEIVTNGIDGSFEAKIKVQFEEWEDAKAAHLSISQVSGGLNNPTFRPWLPPKPLRYTINIHVQQYEAQKRQWDELSATNIGSDAYVQPKVGKRGDVFIQVLGQNKKAIGALKVRVESMVSGEKLAPEYWHSSWMNNSGKPFFTHVFNDKKVYIRNDFKTRTLRIYGDPHLVAEARQMIREEVDRLAQRETTRILDRRSVGFLVREGLGKLVELLGEENVDLNLAARPCRITVKGGDEANHHLQRVLEEAKNIKSSSPVLAGAEETKVCPICTDEASHPEELGCGHTYCSGCLKHFLTSVADAKTFPLVCMGNDAKCDVPMTIPFIRRFLPDATFIALIEAAFVYHLDQHPQEWKYCTTPDCKQIYRRRSEQAIVQCPSCFSTICPACAEEAHEDMTCEERRISKNPAEQQRLNDELAKRNGYKKCPQCDILIEKTAGCNHMTCKCGAHICWACMAISDDRGPFNAHNIYEHMNNVHGNIYEQIPVGVNPGPVDNRAFMAEQADALARIERMRLAAQARDVRFIVEQARAQQEARQREEARRREVQERMRVIEENRRRMVALERRNATEQLARDNQAQRQRQEAENRSWCLVM